MLDILPRPHPPSASVQTALLSAPLAPFIPEAIFFRSMPRLCSPWRKHRKSFRIRFLKIFKKAVCFSFISLWYWKIVSLDVDINCQKSGIWSMHISYSHYSMSWYNIILCMYIYIYYNMHHRYIASIRSPWNSETWDTFQFPTDAFAYISPLPRFQQDLCFFQGFPCIGFLKPVQTSHMRFIFLEWIFKISPPRFKFDKPGE